MSNNFSNISANEFKKYLSGKMTAAEKKAFETLIEKDDFAKDALDGFIAMDNNKRAADFIEKSLVSTSKKIGLQEIENKPPVISLYKSLSIAAIFVLIIGGFWISYSLLNKENNTLAENEVVEKENSSQNEQIIDQDKDEVVDSEKELEDEIEEEIATDESQNSNLKELTPKEDVASAVDAIAENSKKIKETQPQKDLTPTASNNEAFQNDEIAISQNSVRSETKASKAEDFEAIVPENEQSNYEMAYKKFQSGDFVEASNYFELSLRERNKPTESMYYLGLSNFYLQDYNKAINNFDQVIQSSSNNFKYNAMWYKADILIKKGNRKAAKKLLNEISESESLFKNQAIELLKTL